MQCSCPKDTRPVFRLKEPASALTHLAGAVLAVAAMPPLLIHGGLRGRTLPEQAALSVFLLSLIGLYAASAAYHAFNLPGGKNRALKKLDHTMIFFLIAGSYTPVCLITLAGQGSGALLAGVWGAALAGALLEQLWVDRPKWLSALLYIGMGWLCLMKLPAILALLDRRGFGWLLAGGALYTLGGVVYALPPGRLDRRHPAFGAHEYFHLLVLGGSLCHYAAMFYL